MTNKTDSRELNYQDTQDFTDCNRGYIENIDYPSSIQREDGAKIWDLDAYGFMEEYAPDDCPDSVNKSLWRQARLNKINGWFQVCDGVYQFRGYDIANLTLVETATGIVIIDCTTAKETAEKALELFHMRFPKTSLNVEAVILTHTHTDHYGGIEGVTGGKKDIPVYAPENFVTEAALENVIVGDAMSRRSTYQYGTFLEPGVRSHVDSGLGKGIAKGGTVGFAVPTHIVVPASNPSDPHLIPECTRHTIDGIDFEFILCPHTEAPAEMSVYIHGKEVLVAAEIATHTLHNILTPRGAEVRDARLWWKALDKLLLRYGGDVTCICATHHWPIWENGRCKTFLEQQRDTYKYLHDQTVRLINKGYTMLEIAAWFDDENNLPDFMVNQWHNRGYYGTISHDVRAIYQKYLGWYDMNPANLNPLPPVEVAKRYIAAMGGENNAWLIMKQACEEEDYRWAAELGKHLVFANPSEANREFLACVYQKMGEACEAGTWRDMYLVGAAELEKGGPLQETTGSTANPSVLAAVDDELFYDFAASRLNGPKAWEYGDTIMQITQTESPEPPRLISVSGGVLNAHTCRDRQKDEAPIQIVLPRGTLAELIQRKVSVEDAYGLTITKGEKDDVARFFDLFDGTPPSFNIAMPKIKE